MRCWTNSIWRSRIFPSEKRRHICKVFHWLKPWPPRDCVFSSLLRLITKKQQSLVIVVFLSHRASNTEANSKSWRQHGSFENILSWNDFKFHINPGGALTKMMELPPGIFLPIASDLISLARGLACSSEETECNFGKMNRPKLSTKEGCVQDKSISTA